MGIFAALLLMVASYLISAYTKPRPKTTNAEAAIEADITLPEPDEGTPQAVIFGEAYLNNWAVVWYGNYRAWPFQDQGQTIGFTYSWSMLMGLCRGPIDEIVEIDVQDRTLVKPSTDGSPAMLGTMSMSFNQPTLFGAAPSGSGGVVGTGYFMNGDADQVMPANVQIMNPQSSGSSLQANPMPAPIPGYRGTATFLYDGQVSYNQPTPPPWAFRVRRALKGWDGDTWYPEKAVITVSSGPVEIPNPQLSDPNITDDDKRVLPRTVTFIDTIKGMNGAHIIYEGATNRDWGRGLPPSMLDLASFQDAADIMFDEQLACATKWDRTGALSDFMQTVIDYIGATLYPDPKTGLLTLHLVRGDYNVATLPTFSYDSGITKVTNNASGSGDTAANQILVTYRSPVTGKTGQVRAQNLALIRASGGVTFSQSTTYALCPTATIATQLAQRDLRQNSSGLRKLTIEMDRSAWAVTPGSVIQVTNLIDQKIDQMVLRVGKVEYPGGTDGKITLTCVQDVFALNTTAYAYTVDSQPVWKPPVPGDTTITPAPPLVSNLRLAAPWDGNSFKVTWDANPNAQHYDAQVLGGDPLTVARFTGDIMGTTFSYTADDMIADGGHWRTLEIQIRAVSALDIAGPWFTVDVSNPQIDYLAGIQINEAMRQAYFQCLRPVENDWQGIQIYVSPTQGFAPGGDSLVYDGPDLYVPMTALGDGTLLAPATDYYLRAAGYDTFGKDSLNFSSEINFQVMANAPDAGTIIATMIQDGAIDIASFARGIVPPVLVASVPTTYAGSDVIYDQETGQLYRWDGAAYTAGVPATNIEGQLELDNIPNIPTSQLDGQIEAGQISANAVGANEIAAGAITAGKLGVDAVTAGTIAAGAVGADQIAANSITADKLLVGDMSNQCDDSGFDYGDLRSWTTLDTLNWFVDSTTPGLGSDGGKGVGIARTFGGVGVRTVELLNTRKVTVKQGDIWYVAVATHLAVEDDNGFAGAALQVTHSDGTTEIVMAPTVNSTAYTLSTFQYTVGDPTIVSIQLLLQAGTIGGSPAGQTATFDQCQVIRMSSAVLIQDGAISAQKLAADSVTANALAANSVTAGAIVANTITGDKIAADTITANNLAAGSVTADKIMVGTGKNLLNNAGWYGGNSANWNFTSSTGNLSFNFTGSAVIGSNEQTVGVGAITTGVEVDFYSDPVPVQPLTPYIASAWVAATANGGHLGCNIYDAASTVIAQFFVPAPIGAWGSSLSDYTRASVAFLAPEGAATARFFLYYVGVAGGGLFALRPQLEETTPNNVTPGPWGSAGASIITPSQISTTNLSAISANLGSITGGSLNIGGLFIVNASGQVTIQSATSGQRTIVNSNGMTTFGPTGLIKVRVGEW